MIRDETLQVEIENCRRFARVGVHELCALFAMAVITHVTRREGDGFLVRIMLLEKRADFLQQLFAHFGIRHAQGAVDADFLFLARLLVDALDEREPFGLGLEKLLARNPLQNERVHNILALARRNTDFFRAALVLVRAKLDHEFRAGRIVVAAAVTHSGRVALDVSGRKRNIRRRRDGFGIRRPESAAERLKKIVDGINHGARTLARDRKSAGILRKADVDPVERLLIGLAADYNRIPSVNGRRCQRERTLRHLIEILGEFSRGVFNRDGRVFGDHDRRLRH